MFWKSVIVITLVLAASVISAAKAEPVQISWQEAALKIDGDRADWAGMVLSSDKKKGVDYAFSNDGANFYILLVFNDPEIFPNDDTGLTAWFNATGKEKKELGIRFRKKEIPAATMAALIEKKEGALTEQRKKEILSRPSYQIMEVSAINKKEKDLSQETFREMAQPELQVRKSPQGQWVYELRFPLEKASVIGLAPGKTVMLGLEWGGMSSARKKEIIARRNTYYSDSSSHMPESPDLDPEGGGMVGGGGARRLPIPKQYIIWCDLQLAVGK